MESEYSKLKKTEKPEDKPEEKKKELLDKEKEKMDDTEDTEDEKGKEGEEGKEDKKSSEKDPETDCDPEKENCKDKEPKNESVKATGMKLLIEDAQEIQPLIEDTSTGKNYYIEGIFSTPDKKNRNGRVYSRTLWENAINKWKQKTEKNPKYLLGEYNHPSRIEPDPMKAVMKIVELNLKDGYVKGKAKILNNNSETTNQLKALIDEGIKIGVSSRGTGKMSGSIVEEFNLSCYDIVPNPSDYNAELNGLRESIEKDIIEENGKLVCKDGICKTETVCEADKIIEKLNEYTHIPETITKEEFIIKKMLGINESKIQVKLNSKDTLGTSLCKKFSSSETDKILKELKKHPKLEGLVQDIENQEKYSNDDLYIDYDGVIFSLYSSFGLLRLGANGPKTSRCYEVEMIEPSDVIKALKTFKG